MAGDDLRSPAGRFNLSLRMIDLPPPSHLYVGTYTRTTSQGIYELAFNPETGELGEPQLAAEIANPTWLSWAPDRRTLLSVDAGGAGSVASFSVLPSAPASLVPLSSRPTGGGSPCHVVADASGRMVLAASYGEAVVSSFPLHADGTLGERTGYVKHVGSGPDAGRQNEAHAHGVTLSPDNHFAFVPDLGSDKVFAYVIDPATATFTAHNPAFLAVAPGSGPRHLEFSPGGANAYLINEMGGTIVAFDYDSGKGILTPVQTISTLPEGFRGANKTAEIAVHPNGRFVYGSNRGHDSIVVYARDPATGRLTLVEHTPSGGKSPRHFALSPDGAWLITAHEESDDLFVFRVDPQTGRLTKTIHTATVPMAVCILFGR